MATTWYYLVDKRAMGPLSGTELQVLAKSRMITPETFVSLGETGSWVPASTVGGLFDSSAANPPLPVAPRSPLRPQVSAPSPRPPSAVSAVPLDLTLPAKSPFANPVVLAAVSISLACLVLIGVWQLGRISSPPQEKQATSNKSPPKVATDEAPPKSDDVESTPVADNSTGKPRGVERDVDDLRKQRTTLRSEIQKLEDNKSELDRKTRDLERKKKELDDQVKHLTSLLERRKRWSEPQFVFVNPTHFAVGVDLNPDGSLTFHGQDEDLAAQLAISMAREHGIPRIGCDKALTRRLYQAFQEGGGIPAALAEEVRRIVGRRRFLLVPEGADQKLKFVTFKNSTKNERVFGVLKDAFQDGLIYTDFSQRDVRVAKSDLRPGSVRVAEGEDIVTVLRTGDFLDYCLYKVAHKLAESNYVSMTVKVALDEVEGKPQRPLIPVQGDSNLANTVRVIDYLHRIYENRNPHQSVEHAVQYVEDELYSKLVRLGIRVVENEQRNVLRAVGWSQAVASADRLNLTHVLLVEIKRPEREGDYHLAVRLVQVSNNVAIVAESGDRVRGFEESDQIFHLGSGKLTVIETDNATVPAAFKGIESPPLIPVHKRPSAITSRHIVYLEESAQRENLAYRNLFDLRVSELPKVNAMKKNWIKKMNPVNEPADVPSELRMRYVVCLLASACQPLAGRVLEIQNPGVNPLVKISLAAGDRVEPGHLLEVMRITNLPDGRREQEILATQLTVTQVFDNYSLARIVPTGLENIWPGIGELHKDDVVSPANNQRRVVALIEPQLKAPPVGSLTGVEVRNRASAARIENTARQAATAINTLVTKAFSNLGVTTILEGATQGANQPVLNFRRFGFSYAVETQAQILQRVQNLGATHVVIWDMQPVDGAKYKITMGLMPLNATKVNGNPEKVFQFELPEAQLK